MAESNDTTEVEGKMYFLLATLDRRHVEDRDLQTFCPWKGRTSYFSLKADGKINKGAAWYFPSPQNGAEAVANRVAFWQGALVQP